MIEIIAATGLGLDASKATAEHIRKRGILDRHNHLTTRSADGCKDFDEIQSAVIVDVLDRVVE
jgi:hypothetical protein